MARENMFTSVVVGVDGRSGGRDALALAKQLAAPGGRIIRAHVHGTGQVRARVWRGLGELAYDEHADVVVVGASHRGALGQLLLGDNARDALRTAPCSVAIAPSGYAMRRRGFTSIGVGYDGSLGSERALAAARAVGHRHGATVKALTVIGFRVPDGWPTATEPLVGRLHGFHDVESELTYGLPDDELEALSEEVDLLVLGSRGLSPVERLLEGSTSNHLARRAHCPLLVMTPSAISDDQLRNDDATQRVAIEG